MASITVHRTNEYHNRLRPYQLLLDGKKIGIIENGQMRTLEVAPGQHRLVAKIDWCSNQPFEFNIEAGEQQQVTLGIFPAAKIWMPVAIGLMAIHFIVNLIFNFQYLIFLVLPAFLILTYYLSFGRKKYLRWEAY